MNWRQRADVLTSVSWSTMAMPGILGTYDLKGVETEVAKTRAELQQLGSGVRPGYIPPATLDSIELTPVSATTQRLVYDAFHALGQALQSENLKNVQSAYRALAKVLQSAPFNSATQPAAGETLASLANASRALRQAVQSGDLAGAQQAYAQIRQILHHAATDSTGRLTGQNSDEASGRTEPSREDQQLTAQQAYWLVQQDAERDPRLNQLRVPGTPDAPGYNLYLLLAASRLPSDAAQPNPGASKATARTSRVLWWIGINAAAIFGCLLTGIMEFSPESAIPVLLALSLLNGLALMAIRFSVPE